MQRIVVQVEQGVHAQRAQRKTQVNSEHPVQVFSGFFDEFMFYFQSPDEISDRVAGAEAAQCFPVVFSVFVVVFLVLFARFSGQEGILVSRDRVYVQGHQVSVNPVEFLIKNETKNGEIGFYATHAEVLNVHHENDYDCARCEVPQRQKSQQVDGYDQQQTTHHDHKRHFSQVVRFQRGHRRQRVELIDYFLVHDQMVTALNDDCQSRYQDDRRHYPGKHSFNQRGQRVVAAALQGAYGLRCKIQDINASYD